VVVTPSMARRLREAARALEESRQVRDDAIIAAYRKGGGMREIGEAVGMSHVAVANLLKRYGVREPWTTLEQARAEDARRRGDAS
jgi:transposase-like protein